MANSYVRYGGDGSTKQFAIPFPYIKQDDISVSVSGVAVAFTWLNANLIETASAPAEGVGNVLIKRTTDNSRALVVFSAPSNFTPEDLNLAFKQQLYVAQEAEDSLDLAMHEDLTDAAWEGANRRLKNLAEPTKPADAATRNFVITQSSFAVASAEASAEAASGSATAAAASATAAANSVLGAAQHETEAQGYASTAEGYANTAHGFASDAAASAVIAANAVTGVSSFNGRQHAVAPADGDYSAALITNDSTVLGGDVAEALDTLKDADTALNSAIDATNTEVATKVDGAFVADYVADYVVSAVPPYTGQVATRCRVPDASSTTNKQIMSRSRHVSRDKITSLQVAFPNWSLISTMIETGSGGTMTLTASVEFQGAIYPLKFSGGSSASIADGATIVSDSLLVEIPEGSEFFIRSYQTNPTAIVFSSYLDTNAGEAAAYGPSGITDLTGSAAAITDGGADLGYFPCAIIATTSKPAVLIIGDSRAFGSFGGEWYDACSGNGSIAPSISQYGFINAARWTDQAQKFVASHAKRAALGAYCTHVVCQYGVNDFDVGSRTAAQLKASIESIIGYFPTKPVYIVTIEPETTSTDVWATAANQTAKAWEAQRLAHNGNVRSANIAGAAGYFDIADWYESARNSGKWRPGYTVDGVHASPSAERILAGSGEVDARRFASMADLPPRFATQSDMDRGSATDLIVPPALIKPEFVVNAIGTLTLLNSTALQPIFAGQDQTLTLQGRRCFEFEALICIQGGTTSHTTAFGFNPSPNAIAGVQYVAETWNSFSLINSAPYAVTSVTGSPTVLNAASATGQLTIRIRGVFTTNLPTTITPSVQFSANPGGTNQVTTRSYFSCREIGPLGLISKGPWS